VSGSKPVGTARITHKDIVGFFNINGFLGVVGITAHDETSYSFYWRKLQKIILSAQIDWTGLRELFKSILKALSLFIVYNGE
jgi:hypothetical protein